MEGNKSFQQNPEDRFDTEMRLKALENSETSHQEKLDDESRLAVSSAEESLVSDWIRKRVDIPEDLIKGRKIPGIERIKQPEDDYEKDLKKLQALTEKELSILLEEIESKSREGKGLFSKGNLLNGYAIDAQTLESLQVPNHDDVGYELAEKIYNEAKNNPDIFFDTDELSKVIEILKTRIVKGYVYVQVPGFKTPIVKLYFGSKEMGDRVSDEDIVRISRYLNNERELLPITSDFKILK